MCSQCLFLFKASAPGNISFFFHLIHIKLSTLFPTDFEGFICFAAGMTPFYLGDSFPCAWRESRPPLAHLRLHDPSHSRRPCSLKGPWTRYLPWPAGPICQSHFSFLALLNTPSFSSLCSFCLPSMCCSIKIIGLWIQSDQVTSVASDYRYLVLVPQVPFDALLNLLLQPPFEAAAVRHPDSDPFRSTLMLHLWYIICSGSAGPELYVWTILPLVLLSSWSFEIQTALCGTHSKFCNLKGLLFLWQNPIVSRSFPSPFLYLPLSLSLSLTLSFSWFIQSLMRERR